MQIRLLLAAVGFSILACRSPTETVIEVATDLPCSAGPETSISVGPLSSLELRPAAAFSTACQPSTGHVASLVLVPSGDKDAEFAFKVVLAHEGKSVDDCQPPSYGRGCIVARRALRYLPHERLTVPVDMRADCDGIACQPTETCVHARCVSAIIPDPTTCEGSGCGDEQLGSGSGGASNGGSGGASNGGSGGASAGASGNAGESGNGGASAGTSGNAGESGNGGAGGSSGAGAGGSAGSAGAGGSGGVAGAGPCAVSIEALAHHLGDGPGNEGVSFVKSFNVDCACTQPYLSFQIDSPSYEVPPRAYLNGSALPTLQSFFPMPIPPTQSGGWQFNNGNTHDYNLYMQVHYNVSSLLVSGNNSFEIDNGSAADDYNFNDVRLECGSYSTPIGPNIVDTEAWVGTDATRADDDPLGIQGAYYAYGDGVSCTPPSNPCTSGACCINGATLATNPSTNWGCGLGLDLHSENSVRQPYGGVANCFQLKFTGNSGGNPVLVGFDEYSDMTGHSMPLVTLPPINGSAEQAVCFNQVACASGSTSCALTGQWFGLKAQVQGGVAAASFNLCLQSVEPFTR
ncbi:MAG TPA: hypothetical protein VGI10_22345 [Polyangiaceae bacterium]